MYRFMLSRRWVLASVVVLAAVVTMVLLGLWQLRRHGEVGTQNDRVRAQLSLPAAPISELLPAGRQTGDAHYRRVEVEGRYDVEQEVELGNRSYRGQPGKHLLTPLVTASGRALIVDRGWIPLQAAADEADPGEGAVRVTGVLFPSERKGAFGASIPAEGRVDTVPRVDLARIAEQLPYPAYDLYLRVQSQSPPPPGALPVPPELPDLGAGPHLSYAGQWFLFALVAVGVYAALVRREARRMAGSGQPQSLS